MTAQIIERGRNFIVERDPAWPAGQRRATIAVHDQHYWDGLGWQPVTEALENSTLAGFTQAATKLRHLLHVADDGTRRWYPRRGVNEYVHFGVLQYEATPGNWQTLSLGVPVRSGGTLTWTKPAYTLSLGVNWHRVKIDLMLNSSAAAKPVRWAVTLSGLNYVGGSFVSQSDGTTVGQVDQPRGWDANGDAQHPNITVTASYSGGFINFTANLAGAVYPVTIDPTLTLQPDAAAGIDTFIRTGTPNTNAGTDTVVGVGEADLDVDTWRTLIKFDLSTLPDSAVISNATLSLMTQVDQSSNARTFRVYRQKRVWTEGGATWNKYDGTNAWQTAGGFGANDCEQADIGSRAFTATESVGEFKDFSLTPTSKAALDLGNGWLIKADTESDDKYQFWSSDYATAGSRPKLVIVYTVPSGNVLRSLMGVGG